MVKTDLNAKRQEILQESKSTTVDGRNGFFRTIPPTCVSDPYQDPSKFSGTGFRVAFKGGRTASNLNGCFTPLLSLAVNDPYYDKSKIRRNKNKPKSAVQQQRPPFRPSAARIDRTKDLFGYSMSRGDMSQDEIDALVEAELKAKRGAHEKILSQPRNFTTTPCKKGGYGYTGTTFSDREGYRHMRFLSGKQHDGTETQRKKVLRKMHEDKIGDRKPFCGIGKRPEGKNGYFGKDSDTFIHRPISAPVRRRVQADAEKTEGDDRKSFRPGGPMKKGHDPRNYPKWLPNPDTDEKKRRPSSAQVPEKLRDRPTWKPSSGNKTANVRTVHLNRKNLGWRF